MRHSLFALAPVLYTGLMMADATVIYSPVPEYAEDPYFNFAELGDGKGSTAKGAAAKGATAKGATAKGATAKGAAAKGSKKPSVEARGSTSDKPSVDTSGSKSDKPSVDARESIEEEDEISEES